MNATERAKISKAIDLLCTENGFHEAMRILLTLANRSTRVLEELDNTVPISIWAVIHRPTGKEGQE